VIKLIGMLAKMQIDLQTNKAPKYFLMFCKRFAIDVGKFALRISNKIAYKSSKYKHPFSVLKIGQESFSLVAMTFPQQAHCFSAGNLLFYSASERCFCCCRCYFLCVCALSCRLGSLPKG